MKITPLPNSLPAIATLLTFLFTTHLDAQVRTVVYDQGAWFLEGGDTIMHYQAADKSFNGTYTRANYIHPLYSLDGEVITEDFPADHLHQRGIFWAWHQLYVGDQRIGDGWETKDVKWDVTSMTLQRTEPTAVLVAEVTWKSPLWTDPGGEELPIVKETTTLEVFPRASDHRIIDIRIEMRPQYDNVRLGGSEDEKGYGGFSARVRLPEGMVFTGEDGVVTPQNLPLVAGPWMDITGPIGAKGAKAGIAIVSHPQNPGYPHPWILRSKNSMQNPVYPYPGREAVPMSARDPLVLRYCLILHSGLDLAQITELGFN